MYSVYIKCALHSSIHQFRQNFWSQTTEHKNAPPLQLKTVVFSLETKTLGIRSRDQDQDLGLQFSRPRPRPWPSGLETKTDTRTKWTRVHSSLETMVSRSQHCIVAWMDVSNMLQFFYRCWTWANVAFCFTWPGPPKFKVLQLCTHCDFCCE